MLERVITNICLWALSNKRLSGVQKGRIMSALLKNIYAIPVQKVVAFEPDGGILIGGKALDREHSILFRESCISLSDNFARKIIQQQVSYDAIQMGVYQALTPEMILFAKAALWHQQEENKLLSTIVAQ